MIFNALISNFFSQTVKPCLWEQPEIWEIKYEDFFYKHTE